MFNIMYDLQYIKYVATCKNDCLDTMVCNASIRFINYYDYIRDVRK